MNNKKNIASIKRIDYDYVNDILYIAFYDQSNSYGEEISDNIVVRRDWDGGYITGLTIFNLLSGCSS